MTNQNDSNNQNDKQQNGNDNYDDVSRERSLFF